jgi:hypothetical protein
LRIFALYIVGMAAAIGALSLLPAVLTILHAARTLRGF